MKLRYFLAFFCQLLTVTAAFATATVKFANPVPYNAGGTGTNYVVAADLNLDGCADMIAVNTNGVSVRLNNCDGTGTFGPSVVYGTGGTKSFAVAAGDGTIQSAVSYDAGGFDTRAVVIGDVNKDGWNDIVVTSDCQVETCVDGSIRLLLNKGD